MATNWPPTYPYPSWPPEELDVPWLSFSSIQVALSWLQSEPGWSWANPTAQENQNYFQGVRCDEGHPCAGLMIISPTGVRYPFAYCTGATHKSALVLWVVGLDVNGMPSYDLGWGSGIVS